MERRVSIYRNMYDPQVYLVPVEGIFERIRTGVKCFNTIDAIRKEVNGGGDELRIKKLKEQLPAIRFSGEFTSQEDKDCMLHSGLICLDFDKVANLEERKTYFSLLPFVFACFDSPTGRGLKVVVRIPPEISNHRGYFIGLKKFFNDPFFDKSSINISRICFESYDPNIYINYNAVEFTTFSYDEPEKTPGKPGIPVKQVITDKDELRKVISVIRRAQKGQRHAEVIKAGRLMGGYIAANTIAEHDIPIVEDEVRQLFQGEGPQEEATQLKALHFGISEGKLLPIYEIVDETPKDSSNSSTIYINDVWNEMLGEFNTGKKKGESTFFDALDPHFTFRKSEISLISGIGGSGKSTFLHQLLLIQAVKANKKSCFFSPESHPARDFYNEFIEPMVGKTSEKGKPGCMSYDEYYQAATFLKDKIFYTYPKTAHTITEIENNFRYHIEYHGAEFCVVDPYNQLSHNRPAHYREDEYLSDWLTARTRFAEQYNINYIIAAHPNSTLRPEKTDSGMEYPIIHYIHMAGGMMWSNKTFNFGVVHRPFYKSSPWDQSVQFVIHKIKKQKLVGIPGTVNFSYDRNTMRYYDDKGFNPLGSKYAAPDDIQVQNNYTFGYGKDAPF